MITIKEEFVGGPKWKRAIKLGGADAIQLWLALKAHCAEELTDGFVSGEDLEELRGAPKRLTKAMDALINCGRLNVDKTRTAGLVERVEGGYMLHDYLDHAESRARILEKRQMATERKRRSRSKGDEVDVTQLTVTQPVTRDGQRDHMGDSSVTDAGRTRSGPRVRADVPSPAQPRSDPETAAAKDLTASPREEPTPQVGRTVAAAPMNLEAALRMPIAERAGAVVTRSDVAHWVQPEKWPEVQSLAQVFAEATGKSHAAKLGPYSSDRGTRALVALLTTFDASEAERGIRAVVSGQWWRDDAKGKGLSTLSTEVLRRALDEADERRTRRRRLREPSREDRGETMTPAELLQAATGAMGGKP